MDCIEAFSSTLRTARRLAGLTQQDLALRAGVHLNFVGRLERGQAEPSLSTVFAIARALDLTPEAFIAQVNQLTISRGSIRLE